MKFLFLIFLAGSLASAAVRGEHEIYALNLTPELDTKLWRSDLDRLAETDYSVRWVHRATDFAKDVAILEGEGSVIETLRRRLAKKTSVPLQIDLVLTGHSYQDSLVDGQDQPILFTNLARALANLLRAPVEGRLSLRIYAEFCNAGTFSQILTKQLRLAPHPNVHVLIVAASAAKRSVRARHFAPTLEQTIKVLEAAREVDVEFANTPEREIKIVYNLIGRRALHRGGENVAPSKATLIDSGTSDPYLPAKALLKLYAKLVWPKQGPELSDPGFLRTMFRTVYGDEESTALRQGMRRLRRQSNNPDVHLLSEMLTLENNADEVSDAEQIPRIRALFANSSRGVRRVVADIVHMHAESYADFQLLYDYYWAEVNHSDPSLYELARIVKWLEASQEPDPEIKEICAHFLSF